MTTQTDNLESKLDRIEAAKNRINRWTKEEENTYDLSRFVDALTVTSERRQSWPIRLWNQLTSTQQ